MLDLRQDADVVAPALLGARLRVGDVTVRLTEVEAYAGTSDPASHAFRGPTPRSHVMFGPAGHLYVYLSHGIWHCANIVCGQDGRAAAVLLRAGEVVDGLDVARARRPGVVDAALARGPGCLGRVLGLSLADSGARLGDAQRRLQLWAATEDVGRVAVGPRVGVSAAPDVPWRFWIDGDSTVSAYRRSPRAARPETGTTQAGSPHT